MRTKRIGLSALALTASTGYAQTFYALDNGISGDGHLAVNPDAFGAITDWTWPGNGDRYDPVDGPENTLAFACSFFLYVPGATSPTGTDERLAIAEPFADLDNFYNFQRGGSFDYGLEPTAPAPAVSDSDNDGFDDTLTATFFARTFAPGVDLLFELTQTCEKPATTGSAVAVFRQVLTITNREATPVPIELHRHFDPFLQWDGEFEDVAGTVRGPGGKIIPYAREANGNPSTGQVMSLTSPQDYNYTAAKSGDDPDGPGPDPAYAWGTDFQMWDNFGKPQSWKNHTAFVGPGPACGEAPGRQPSGSLHPFDSFETIAFEVTVPASGSIVIEVHPHLW
ncbi:MAG: hypothetical protein IH985_02220 [Planctomycetes bacterium]|nr:hypothetical protein [Planctomycetota bacterium]